MTGRSSRLALAAVALAVAWAAPAAAATVGIVVAAPAPWREPVEVSAAAWFEPRGIAVRTSALSRRDADALARCYGDNDEGCAAPIAARARVDALFLLVVTVLPAGDEDAVVTVGGWQLAADGRVVAFDVESCEACRPPAIGVATASLLTSLDRMSRARQRGALRIRVTPAGARVVIDGVAVGLAPLTHAVKAGTHVVRAELAGRAAVSRRVAVADRQTVDVTLALDPLDRAPPAVRSRRPIGVTPWLLGGAGATAVAAGVVLIAIDRPRMVDGRQNPSYRPTVGPGIALTVAGAAGVLAASYLAFVHAPAAAPVVQVGAGELTVGYRASF